MKIEDFETRFNEIISNPDTGLANAPDFLEEVRGDYASAVSLGEKVAELEARVKDLQEANVKLYLATTGGVVDEDEPIDESDGDAYIEAVFDELMKDEED